MALENEVQKFDEILPELLKQEGRFALICGTELVGVYDTYRDAAQVGYKRAAGAPFLVRQITRTPELAVVSGTMLVL